MRPGRPLGKFVMAFSIRGGQRIDPGGHGTAVAAPRRSLMFGGRRKKKLTAGGRLYFFPGSPDFFIARWKSPPKEKIIALPGILYRTKEVAEGLLAGHMPIERIMLR